MLQELQLKVNNLQKKNPVTDAEVKIVAEKPKWTSGHNAYAYGCRANQFVCGRRSMKHCMIEEKF